MYPVDSRSGGGLGYPGGESGKKLLLSTPLGQTMQNLRSVAHSVWALEGGCLNATVYLIFGGNVAA